MCEIKYRPVGFAKSDASPTELFVLSPFRLEGHFLMPEKIFDGDSDVKLRRTQNIFSKHDDTLAVTKIFFKKLFGNDAEFVFSQCKHSERTFLNSL